MPGPREIISFELQAAQVHFPFHFEDTQVVLQAEEQKYKIHRYFLTRESVFFQDLFSLPQGDATSAEGTDDSPIKLPETPTKELDNLLRFFYFGMHDDYKASLPDWIAILSISTRFIFEKPFDLIGLAIKFDVEQWLKPAYRRIVIRNSLITHAEALKVPFPMAVMLMRSREQYWKVYGNDTPTRRFSPNVLDSIIDSEIRLMELDSKVSRGKD
ncbi:hypothetical protein BC826DRAFT_1106749 [Russula brevipes]|nr:hypothetical protein BC826DRAFT_1106749 [Russula brevipes]